jgi:hypothetical protein
MERVLAKQMATDLRRSLTISEMGSVSGAHCWTTAQYMTEDPSAPGGGHKDCPCLECD